MQVICKKNCKLSIKNMQDIVHRNASRTKKKMQVICKKCKLSAKNASYSSRNESNQTKNLSNHTQKKNANHLPKKQLAKNTIFCWNITNINLMKIIKILEIHS